MAPLFFLVAGALSACGDEGDAPPSCGAPEQAPLEAAALATALPPDNSCSDDTDCVAADVLLSCPSGTRIGYCPVAMPRRFEGELAVRRAEAEAAHCDTFAANCVSTPSCAPATPVCASGVCQMRVDVP